jgi:hypothetical protein
MAILALKIAIYQNTCLSPFTKPIIQKAVGDWYSQSWGEKQWEGEDKEVQGSGGMQHGQSPWKESSGNLGNPRPVPAQHSTCNSEEINSFLIGEVVAATNKGKEIFAEKDGKMTQKRDAENKEGSGENLDDEMEEEGPMQAMYNKKEKGKGIMGNGEVGRKGGDVQKQSQYGPRPNLDENLESLNRAVAKMGFKESRRDITPMEITHPVVGVTNETNGLDHEANKVNGSYIANLETAMQTTERRREGTNLRTWKRMARVENVATRSRDAC